MVIADLERLIGPPSVVMPAVEWDAIEQSLGTGLPGDYKNLASRYSSLEFDDLLLVSNLALLPLGEIRQIKTRQLRALQESVGNGPRRNVYFFNGESRRNLQMYPCFPDPGGLLEWGNTINGDHCLWRMIGDPDDWPVVITDDGICWFEYPGGMLDFLVGWLNREIETHVLSDEYPAMPTIREQEIGTGNFVGPLRWREYFDSLELLRAFRVFAIRMCNIWV